MRVGMHEMHALRVRGFFHDNDSDNRYDPRVIICRQERFGCHCGHDAHGVFLNVKLKGVFSYA